MYWGDADEEGDAEAGLDAGGVTVTVTVGDADVLGSVSEEVMTAGWVGRESPAESEQPVRTIRLEAIRMKLVLIFIWCMAFSYHLGHYPSKKAKTFFQMLGASST